MKTTRKTAALATEASNTNEFAAKVAEAAYFIAEQRGFAAGYEMEDWLAAEAQIRQQSSIA